MVEAAKAEKGFWSCADSTRPGMCLCPGAILYVPSSHAWPGRHEELPQCWWDEQCQTFAHLWDLASCWYASSRGAFGEGWPEIGCGVL